MMVDHAELRAWLEANCPPEMWEPPGEDDICWGGRRFMFRSEAQKLWLERCVARGLTVPTWPKEYGGANFAREDAAIFKAEMQRIHARPPLVSFGMSGDFQDEIKCLGIEASPSFVRQPEGNGVAERFIRTLKENVLWVRTFKTIEELRAELVAFAKRYNESWLVARHGYKTPARVREEQTMPPIAIDPTLAAALPLAA